MKKKSLFAFLLCIALVTGALLTGCAMDRMNLVVGRVGGENVTYRDVSLYANYLLMNQGYKRSDLQASDIAGLNGSALDQVITDKVIFQKAAALGLYPLSEENRKKVDDNFNSYISSMEASYIGSYQGSADPEALARKDVDAALQTAGLTEDGVRQLTTVSVVRDALMAETTKDVSITDDEIKAEYDKLLSGQQSSYTSDPTAYDTALTDGQTIVVYRPEGYRYVKHILIAMPQDIAAQIQSATSSGDAATVSKLREQGLAQIKSRADEVLAKVKAGGDFDALVAQYGEDPGMQAEPAKSEGYQVGAKSSYVPEFLAAAMGLANAGDTTDLVATDYGYHIIKYVGAVPAGPVPLEDVKDVVRQAALAAKRADAFNALIDQWRSETPIKTNAGKIPVEGAAASTGQ